MWQNITYLKNRMKGGAWLTKTQSIIELWIAKMRHASVTYQLKFVVKAKCLMMYSQCASL